MDGLPTFLVIGAQKSGTSWLHEQLARHPDVFMSARKELRFFFDANQPVDWYRQHFSGARADQQRGESTPEYMIKHEAPEDIRRLLPAIRLICIVRDPAARAFSQWQMARKLGNIPIEMPFIEAFRQNRQYMRERGEYVVHLEHYSRSFPPAQLATFVYDDLEHDVRAFWRSVLVHLGVTPDFEPPTLMERIGANDGTQHLTAANRRELVDYYEPFTARLELLLGRKLADWRGV